MAPISLVEISGGWIAGIVILCVVGGLLIGYFVSRYVFKRELKKHPPIDEKVIRAMFSSMGRKPSEAQVRQVMRSVKDAQSKK